MLKINGFEICSSSFAYDGCHKIYILENGDNINKALECGYNIFDISKIEEYYNNSCELRFISNWNLDKRIVKQFENAKFEY